MLLFILFILTGCGGGDSNDPVQQTKTYYTTFKVVNSSDEIIETANVTVDGKEGEGGEGLYSFNLKKGEHNLKVTDSSGKYFNYEETVTVNKDNEFYEVPLMKNIKKVDFEVLNKNNKPVENAVISIKNIEPSNINNNVYSFNLEKNNTYIVKAYDSEGKYLKEEKEIKINDDSSKYTFKLEKKEVEPEIKTVNFEVLDQNNNSIDNAVVEIKNEEPEIVDKNKYFYDLEQGKNYSVRVYDEKGYYNENEFEITVNATGNEEIINLEQKKKEVTFRVLDQYDSPVENAFVEIDNLNPEEVNNNEYIFVLDIGSNYDVKVFDDKNIYYKKNVSCSIEKSIDVYSINLEQKIKEVQFEILDQNNKPIEQAELNINGETIQNDGSNIFKSDLEIGKTYTVIASDSNKYFIEENKNLKITKDKNTYQFELKEVEKVSLSGTVKLAVYNLALQNVEVRYKEQYVITDENGNFELDNIPKGERKITVTSLFDDKKEYQFNLYEKNNNEELNLELPVDFELGAWDNMIGNKILKWEKQNIYYYTELSDMELELVNFYKGLEHIENWFTINDFQLINFKRTEIERNADLVIKNGNNSGGIDDKNNNVIESASIWLNPGTPRADEVTVAHEIGHILGFSHSTGEDPNNYESIYDNYLMRGAGEHITLNEDLPDKMIFGLSYSLNPGENL